MEWMYCILEAEFFRGWVANLNGDYKEKKKRILDQLKKLDYVVEVRGLKC